MRTYRFPFTDTAGVITSEAKAALGVEGCAGQCGHDFAVNVQHPDGWSEPVTVTLVGDRCFIPAFVPAPIVAEIEAQLAPLVESPETAQRVFLGEVFAGLVPSKA